MAKKGKVQAERDRKIKDDAERWKEYFGRFEKCVDSMGGKGTFALIPSHELEFIFSIRYSAIKIVSSAELPFPNNMLKRLNKILSTKSKHEQITTFPNGYVLSIYDYVTIWLTLNTYLTTSKETKKEWFIELYKRLEIIASSQVKAEYISVIHTLFELFANQIGKPTDGLVWVEPSFKVDHATCRFSWTVMFRYVKSKPKHITIQNETRTIYPVYHCVDKKAVVMQYRLKDIGLECAFGNLKVNVYILEHAVNRLFERMKPAEVRHIRLYFKHSLLFPVFHFESANRFLIEYNFLGIKSGYFVAEYIEGIVLIRTFLFLTNNGTPEGSRLNELTGLSKIDKQYLHFDQLETFLNRDIGQNEHIMKIFVEAGCDKLFNMSNFLNCKTEETSKIASFIDHYLTTGEFNDDFDFEDEE